MEKIKILNQKLNDYFVETKDTNMVLNNNISVFYKLSILTNNELLEYFNEKDNIDDIESLTKLNFLEKIQLATEFYKYLNIDFDIEKYIQNGTIDFQSQAQFEDNIIGVNKKENGYTIIDVINSGTIFDVAVLVHELSHFRDTGKDDYNEVWILLTEALAYTEKLIFIDFLSKNGYEKDAFILKRIFGYNCYLIADEMIPIYEMLQLYNDLGSISKENYDFYYINNDYYDEDITKMEEFLETKEISFNSRYILGMPLAVYLFEKYKNDNEFINTIQILHDKISKCSFAECLNIMKLMEENGFLLEKIGESLRNFIEELKHETAEKNKMLIKM